VESAVDDLNNHSPCEGELMTDRMTADIAIGGRIPLSLVPGLIAAIKAEGIYLTWDEEAFFAPTGAADLLQAAHTGEQPGCLHLVNHEVAGGTFDTLEGFLFKHNLAFDRWCEGRYEFDPELVQFRPGMKEPIACITTKAKQPVVEMQSVSVALDALKQGAVQKAVSILSDLLAPVIAPLTHLEIIDDPPAPGSQAFTVPGTLDWALLASQKQWLLEQAPHSAEAAGLVELLDAIQDAALEREVTPHAVVLPNL
jgi:hypothetical protein